MFNRASAMYPCNNHTRTWHDVIVFWLYTNQDVRTPNFYYQDGGVFGNKLHQKIEKINSFLLISEWLKSDN